MEQPVCRSEGRLLSGFLTFCLAHAPIPQPCLHSPLSTQDHLFEHISQIISCLCWKLSSSFPVHLVLNVKPLGCLQDCIIFASLPPQSLTTLSLLLRSTPTAGLSAVYPAPGSISASGLLQSLVPLLWSQFPQMSARVAFPAVSASCLISRPASTSQLWSDHCGFFLITLKKMKLRPHFN